MHTCGLIFKLQLQTGMISMSLETFLLTRFMIIQSMSAWEIMVPGLTQYCLSKSSGHVGQKWKLLTHFSPGRTMTMEIFLIVVVFVLLYHRSATDLIPLLYLHRL